jgi:hypothetical protein
MRAPGERNSARAEMTGSATKQSGERGKLSLVGEYQHDGRYLSDPYCGAFIQAGRTEYQRLHSDKSGE